MATRETFDVDSAFQEPWKVQADNLVGGWCVTLASEQRTPADGAIELASFLTRRMAEYVVAMHNWAVGSGETEFILRDIECEAPDE